MTKKIPTQESAAASSSTDPSSSSSSSSSSSNNSNRSNTNSSSNWWKFWKDPKSSSGSNSGSSNSSLASDSNSTNSHSTTKTSNNINPDRQITEFTLITPSLTYNSNQANSKINERKTLNVESQKDQDQQLPPYDLFTSDDIISTLQRLLTFWNQIKDDQNSGSDIGLQSINDLSNQLKFKPQSKSAVPSNFSNTTPLPKLRRQPLSPIHKLNFKDGKFSLIQDSFQSNLSSFNHPDLPIPKSPLNRLNRSSLNSAWWLDITCPSSSDMHQLQKIFPLHPLTIEDILSQDTREKTETFDGLGYYLISFRGLNDEDFVDEDDDDDDEEEEEEEDGDDDNNDNNEHDDGGKKDTDVEKDICEPQESKIDEKDIKKGKPEIVKARSTTIGKGSAKFTGNSHEAIKSGIMNLKKQSEMMIKRKRKRKKKKIGYKSTDQKETISKSTSNLEKGKHEPSNQFLSKAIDKAPQNLDLSIGAVNMYLVVFKDGIISFHFDDLQKHIDRVKNRIQNFGLDSQYISPHWIAYELMDSFVDGFFPILELIEDESDLLDEHLTDQNEFIGLKNCSNPSTRDRHHFPFRKLRHESKNNSRKLQRRIGRSEMLNRITINRRLVVSMSRLMAQKFQTVEALRKRMLVDVNDLFQTDGHLHRNIGNEEDEDDEDQRRWIRSREILLYLGDLEDHILSLNQGLGFYDTILSNAHQSYLSSLRLGLNETTQAQDVLIVRLYLISLIFLPMSTLIGLHSMNIHIPTNGDEETHLRADGSRSPFNVFWIVLFGSILVGILFTFFIKLVIIKESEKVFGRAFPHLLKFSNNNRQCKKS
ncbi:hypothetical protein O181_028827 [Austropuccinia psidii MF-1]|uniref:Uncharacterized protein n=1 Tax=Austropuccinia psidii MF-1 TaxID=1389203 RepID=A0A9Q3CSP9_9BASI|nr:hypothetical protein [Austropuccinia psidii MF-1]